MFRYVVFAILLFVVQCSSKYTYSTKYIDLPVDHFSYTQNETFKLRYLINDTFWDQDKGPILFYTGNEGSIELFAQNTGFIWELAPHVKGCVVFAEHRYYGESLPFGNTSYSNLSKLGYLTSSQALADYASLLREINKPGKYSHSFKRSSIQANPVIAIGGSYGGMLAAWFRMKYPHLIAGAIASSAPILQFSGITPCEVFSRIVTSDFKTSYNSNCSSNIKKSWAIMKNMSLTAGGLASLTKIWNLCEPLKNYKDLEDYLIDSYSNLAMANYPYEADFLAPMPGYPVREVCSRLNETFDQEHLVQKIQEALTIYTNFTGKVKCLDLNVHATPELGDLGWHFQSCTEMVMPMCSGGADDMFPSIKWNFKEFSDECYKKFSVRPDEFAAIFNYGGSNLGAASNIIFSNGLLDPWSGGGVLKSIGDTLKAVIIPEGGHHLDLRASNPSDPASVIQARIFHTRTMQDWIQNYWAKHGTKYSN